MTPATPPSREPADDSDLDLDTSKTIGTKKSRKLSTGRVQVLALSGGGYRGVFTTSVLAHVEEHFKLRTASRFDLLIGTSMGALIASALACDIAAETISEKTVAHGEKIFPPKLFKDAKRLVHQASYDARALRGAIVDTIGEANAERSLAEIDKPLAICAVNFTHGRPEIFRSRGLAGNQASRTPLIDAVLASAAAPTYFPAHEIRDESFIDGGVIANAPEMQGLTEALARLRAPLASVYVLSIGTAARKEGAALETIGAASGLTWMNTHDLFNATIAAQEALAREQCESILGGRFYLLDRQPLKKQEPAVGKLDQVGDLTTKTLWSMAREAWREHQTIKRFALFFKS